MTTTQLTYFIAAAELRNLSQVAEHMNVSQPAVSGAIRDLESEFGIQLFRRAHRKLTLTSEGEDFYREATALVAHIQSFRHRMSERGGNAVKCSFGISPNVATVYLGDIYQSMRKNAPEMEFDVQEGLRVDLVRMVRNGILDIVCVPVGDGFEQLTEGLKYKKAIELPFCFYAHPSLFHAETDILTVRDIREVPLAMNRKSSIHNKWIHQIFAQEGLSPKVLCEVNQTSTIERLTRQGLAGGILPASFFGEGDEVKSYRLDAAGANVLYYFIWKDRTAAVDRFLRCTQDAFSTDAQ